ncbi:hypothetical protein PsorP6_013524 [Peronosclerospora sorghi]|uniref:Uncharacterized protein n=1 Tax=Peronosclerospora sorghi TaxID=230839 RepID=A0ACC0VFR0_9STRA|nr:hypothetical protein PsorP6_013524 [Peronosclerospora sorghi]
MFPARHANPLPKRHSASWTSEMVTNAKRSMVASPLPWWLFGTAGLVATTLTVGAAARLTRTGASTLYWKPSVLHARTSERDWSHDFDVYRNFCARSQRTPMTLEDFKRNAKREALHRMLGEVTALSFVGPLAYFGFKGKIPVQAQAPLALIAGLGVTQWYIGRAMVEHNVKGARHGDDSTFQGPTFFLPIHSALSLANFSLLLWTGLSLVSPVSRALKVRALVPPTVLHEVGTIRQQFMALTGLAATTALAGSLVAEIDAGREFQTFPKMGDHWLPPGLLEQKPWVRNLYANVALVQWDHRVLALTTLAAYTTVFLKARKATLWSHVPEDAKRAMILALAAVGGQVIMGATMLVNEVPTALAMVHQGGAAVVLGSSLWVLHALRFANPRGVMGAAVATAAAKYTKSRVMFTGIIEEIGTVVAVQKRETLLLWTGERRAGVELVVQAHVALQGASVGCSIAVNGTCLTATSIEDDRVSFGLAPETLRRTNLRDLAPGDKVNLERSMAADARNSGHFVQGHVDGTGTIVSFRREDEALWVTISTLPEILRSVVPKGYIAIDGTSLTVCDVDHATASFAVMLIAHTQNHITLPQKRVGDHVNLEPDVLGKYAARCLETVQDRIDGLEQQLQRANQHLTTGVVAVVAIATGVVAWLVRK